MKPRVRKGGEGFRFFVCKIKIKVFVLTGSIIVLRVYSSSATIVSGSKGPSFCLRCSLKVDLVKVYHQDRRRSGHVELSLIS